MMSSNITFKSTLTQVGFLSFKHGMCFAGLGLIGSSQQYVQILFDID